MNFIPHKYQYFIKRNHEIFAPKNISLYGVAQVYGPPRPEQTFTLKWLDSIDNSLQLSYPENKQTVVTGGVNIDLWKPHPLATKWLEICSAFGLVQIITELTSVKIFWSLIDHVCASEDATVLHHKVVKYGTSHHFLVLVKLDIWKTTFLLLLQNSQR